MSFVKTTDKRTGEEVKIYYEDCGQGQPVVLIHGWPSSHEMWEPQALELPKHGIRCISYDRRGFGKSSRTWDGYDYDSLTDDLKAVLDHLDLQDVVLVGFSMGGGEVVRYFSRYGGARVKKAVLVSAVVPSMLKTDANPGGVPLEMFEKMKQQITDDRITFLDGFGKDFFGVNLINHPVSQPYLEYFRMLAAVASPKATLDCLDSFAYTDFTSEMAAVNVPTLIIHGDADKTVPITTGGERSSQMIPNSQYLVYEGAPHGLFITEKDRLTQDLLSFIGGAL